MNSSVAAQNRNRTAEQLAGFQFTALPEAPFSHLSGLSDAELAKLSAQRYVADEKPGYPCRVSLVDAEVGERLILLSFTHHDVDSPYRSSGPIFVREDATETLPGPNEIPECVRHRLLSLRAYDLEGLMVDASVIEGQELEDEINRLFANELVGYLHVHNARRGCYSCRVDRITSAR